MLITNTDNAATKDTWLSELWLKHSIASGCAGQLLAFCQTLVCPQCQEHSQRVAPTPAFTVGRTKLQGGCCGVWQLTL